MESLLRKGVGEGPLSGRDFRRYDSPISQVRKQENFLPGVIQLESSEARHFRGRALSSEPGYLLSDSA